MSDVNVLVVFHSQFGAAERLALAAGVGAIQARGNIRLRRVAKDPEPAALEALPELRENLERMSRDYVAPRPADPVWADVIVLATPDGSSAEIASYCSSLQSLGPMAGKIAAPLTPNNRDATLAPIYAAAACAGMIVAPAAADSADPITAAREFGQRVTRMARALKTAT